MKRVPAGSWKPSQASWNRVKLLKRQSDGKPLLHHPQESAMKATVFTAARFFMAFRSFRNVSSTSATPKPADTNAPWLGETEDGDLRELLKP